MLARSFFARLWIFGVFTQTGKMESSIAGARFALLCDAGVARGRGIPAFAGMTEKKDRNDRKTRQDGFYTDYFAGMAECAMPVGNFSHGSGFSEFLHGIFRRNDKEGAGMTEKSGDGGVCHASGWFFARRMASSGRPLARRVGLG